MFLCIPESRYFYGHGLDLGVKWICQSCRTRAPIPAFKHKFSSIVHQLMLPELELIH